MNLHHEIMAARCLAKRGSRKLAAAYLRLNGWSLETALRIVAK